MILSPEITVAIPFHNVEATLACAIESVIAQQLQDFELLLVNDGSTDASLEIANEYCDDNRVTLVNDGCHLGLAMRLNQIAGMARSQYLARMDGDDIMHPARLKRQVDYLDSHRDVDLVGTDVYFVDSNYAILGRGTTRRVRLCRRFSYIKLFHPSVTGRTEWFRGHPYSSQFPRCEDTELWIRAGGGANIQCINDPLMFYNRMTYMDVEKTIMSLRQYAEIISLHTHRTCRTCRFREIIITRLKAFIYSILAASGVMDQFIRYRHYDTNEVDAEAIACIKLIRDQTEKRKNRNASAKQGYLQKPVGIVINS